MRRMGWLINCPSVGESGAVGGGNEAGRLVVPGWVLRRWAVVAGCVCFSLESQEGCEEI